jgi:hypothetical protein
MLAKIYSTIGLTKGRGWFLNFLGAPMVLLCKSLFITEAKPNLSQLYLSRLSLVQPAKLNFFKIPASELLRVLCYRI